MKKISVKLLDVVGYWFYNIGSYLIGQSLHLDTRWGTGLWARDEDIL